MDKADWKQFEGQWVDRAFHLLELLGFGAFGGVFRADHFIGPRFVRSVALKLIPVDPEEGEQEIDRKLDELIAAANLRHPYLLDCHHPGSAEVGPAAKKFLYLVMEMATGSLKSHRKEPLSAAEAADLVEHIASALAFLHQKHLVHRDLKPDNILRVGDVWKLSDYGLIRELSPGIIGHTSVIAGTPSYMPPESFHRIYTSAFDIWSLGVLLFEALTGKLPFNGASIPELFYSITHGQPQLPLGNLRPFDRMIEGCLIKDYHARWTAGQILSELKSIRSGQAHEPDDMMRTRHLTLAVLLEDMVATPEILQTLWSVDPREALATAAQLIQLSLAQPDGTGIRLNADQMNYVRSQWPDGQSLGLIHQAIRLSEHVIRRDPLQFASQVVGRLLSFLEDPVIRKFADRLVAGAPVPWLRSLHCALHPPGTGLIRTLAGHSLNVLDVAMSVDGRLSVSGSEDQTLKVWDLKTGRELLTMTGHSASVGAIAISGDGRLAVSASDDETLKVWGLETGRELRTLKGHSDRIDGVAMTPDGRRAISASSDKTLKVWDLETGRELRTLKGHSDRINGVAITADGRRAVSASSDKTLKVWDLETGRKLRTLEGHTSLVHGVAVSRDGRHAISASRDRTLKIWELERGRELLTLKGHSDSVIGVAASGDGKRIVSASLDQTLRVWDAGTGQELCTLIGSGGNTRVAVSGDGRQVVSVSDGALRVWDVEMGGGVPSSEGHARRVNDVAVSGDARWAISASDDGTLKVWDVETGCELRTMEGPSDRVRGVYRVALGGNGRCAVSTSADQTLKVWDVETGRELRTLTGHSSSVVGVAMSRDGRRALSASLGEMKVWNVETGRDLRTLTGSTDWICGVAMTGDGRLAVSAEDNGTLRLWDLETGQPVRTLTSPGEKVRAVAMSGDGRHAVSVSEDKTLKVRDLETGRKLGTLVGHASQVRSVAISRDGRRTVSASYDSTIKVWDLETGRVLATFTCDSPATSCNFAKPDLIVAGDRGGRVYFLALEFGPGPRPTITMASPA